jgi:hypothetical protein
LISIQVFASLLLAAVDSTLANMGVLQEAGKILVLNAGSSSLKFKLFSLAPGLVAGVGGMIDRIGDTVNSNLVAKGNGQKWTEKVPIKDHVSAMECIMGFLSDKESSSIHKEVQAVGHRIVHGLDIHQAALLDDAAIAKLHQAATLAPLHNPPGLQGLSAAMKVFQGVPQVCAVQLHRRCCLSGSTWGSTFRSRSQPGSSCTVAQSPALCFHMIYAAEQAFATTDAVGV